MLTMKIYVEGGGDTNGLRLRRQSAFRQLLEKARPGGRKPRLIAHGGRQHTFEAFRTACANAGPDEMMVLLVDSEAPVAKKPWEHLRDRDRWSTPAGASDDQCQLMVACMEAWILAVRATLKKVFGGLSESSLGDEKDLEKRTKDEVQTSLANATRRCPTDRRYMKGKRSIQVLGQVDPKPLRDNLPHFARLIDMLDRYL